MTHEQLFELHQQLCGEALGLMKRKNQDYRGGDRTDPFKNFKGSLIFGVEPEIGTMIRMNDKFQRVSAFLANGELAVKDENIRDIGLDLINYSVLLMGQLIDRINDEKRDRRKGYRVAEIPEGYHTVPYGETIKENDKTWDDSLEEWVTVPHTKEFLKVGENHFFPIIRAGANPYRSTQIKIPATVPISEGYYLLKTGDRLGQFDKFYMAESSSWTPIPNTWLTIPYDKSMGPVIRPTREDY